MRATEEHCKKKAREQAEFVLATRERDTQVNIARPIGRRPWTWDIENSRYVDADGTVLPYEDLRQMMYRYLESLRSRVETLTGTLFARGTEGNIPEWEFEMREIIQDAYGAAYMLGRGGRYQMTYRDWSNLGRVLSEQYDYLNKFAAQITAAEFKDENEARAFMSRAIKRANLYPLSARQAMQRGYTYAQGAPELPAYPGDGQSECLGNCGCHWELERDADRWNCWWIRGKSKDVACDTCIQNEARWNPLVRAAT